MKVEIETICCGKEMHHNPCVQNMLDRNCQDQFWICWECGHFIALSDTQLDEEMVENYKEMEECLN